MKVAVPFSNYFPLLIKSRIQTSQVLQALKKCQIKAINHFGRKATLQIFDLVKYHF